MTQARMRYLAYKHARYNVGVGELGGNNRGPKVSQIIRYARGVVGEPWCVDFMIWCYGHAGSKVVKPGYPRAVRYMAPRHGIAKVTKPHRGDLIRYTFDHTGMFKYPCNANGKRRPWRLATHIKAIEGNTGPGAVSDGNGHDGVHIKVRPKSLVRDYLKVLR